MAYDGFGFVFVYGIALAALLYYMFNDSNNNRNNSNNDHESHNGSANNGQNFGPSFDTCAICYNDLSGWNVVKAKPCGHPFHKPCIVHWQTVSSERPHYSCPICRQKIDKVQ